MEGVKGSFCHSNLSAGSYLRDESDVEGYLECLQVRTMLCEGRNTLECGVGVYVATGIRFDGQSLEVGHGHFWML
jgi:hypothetical protein